MRLPGSAALAAECSARPGIARAIQGIATRCPNRVRVSQLRRPRSFGRPAIRPWYMTWRSGLHTLQAIVRRPDRNRRVLANEHPGLRDAPAHRPIPGGRGMAVVLRLLRV